MLQHLGGQIWCQVLRSQAGQDTCHLCLHFYSYLCSGSNIQGFSCWALALLHAAEQLKQAAFRATGAIGALHNPSSCWWGTLLGHLHGAERRYQDTNTDTRKELQAWAESCTSNCSYLRKKIKKLQSNWSHFVSTGAWYCSCYPTLLSRAAASATGDAVGGGHKIGGLPTGIYSFSGKHPSCPILFLGH